MSSTDEVEPLNKTETIDVATLCGIPWHKVPALYFHDSIPSLSNFHTGF